MDTINKFIDNTKQKPVSKRHATLVIVTIVLTLVIAAFSVGMSALFGHNTLVESTKSPDNPFEIISGVLKSSYDSAVGGINNIQK